MTRVMCVRLPHWPLQRLRREQPEHDGPLVLYADAGQRGLRVTACSRRALDAGVRAEMPLAEAKALLDTGHGGVTGCGLRVTGCGLPSVPNPQSSIPRFVLHDPAADRAGLETLAGWCRRFSPVVGIEDPDSLLLDVTGCAHLFGGEEELSRSVADDFHRWGFTVRIALADTIGAAWAFARYGDDRPPQVENRELPDGKRTFREFVAATRVAKSQRGAEPHSQLSTLDSPFFSIRNPQSAIRISSLPIEALRLPPETVATLHQLAIRRVEQLQALPRCTLPSRFGPELLRRLDQTTGDCPETITPVRPPEPVVARHEFEHPTPQQFALEGALRQLVEQVLRELAGRMEGVQRLQVALLYEDHRQEEFTVGLLRPSACAEHVAGLLFTRLERVALSGNVAELQMTVAASAPLESQQPQLFDTGTNPAAERELSQLLDRLSARLGGERVLSPRLHPDAQPEYAVRWERVEGGRRKAESRKPRSVSRLSTLDSRPAVRPLSLLPDPQPIDVVSVIPDGPPLRFFRHGRSHTVVRWWGPERIETGWWRHRHVRRDYYRVETEAGQQFWIFRRPETWEWCFQGEGS